MDCRDIVAEPEKQEPDASPRRKMLTIKNAQIGTILIETK